ncbi:hypothetical protein C4K00_0018 [Pseudomonas synxantha]|uniref:hypothetical protein n=1 Tax=Pseudomonas synxantha TaxID=47883 RepID=UPI000F55D8FD|nr:hypothetical protein [Pseudomonas synxantha]AZE70286.1 hypothetical protein C4K00_0018 [Pseudomonas synxantha]
MLLKTDFEADWIVEMRRIMEEHWAIDLSSAKTEELAAQFFLARTRRVEPRPRAVLISNSFACPLEREAAWAELKVKIETAEDLSPHLSLKIEDFKGKEGLLLDWGIYRLPSWTGAAKKNNCFRSHHPAIRRFPSITSERRVFRQWSFRTGGDRRRIRATTNSWPSAANPRPSR